MSENLEDTNRLLEQKDLLISELEYRVEELKKSTETSTREIELQTELDTLRLRYDTEIDTLKQKNNVNFFIYMWVYTCNTPRIY